MRERERLTMAMTMTMTRHVIVNPFFPRSLKYLGGTSQSPFSLHTLADASCKSLWQAQAQVLIIAALVGVRAWLGELHSGNSSSHRFSHCCNGNMCVPHVRFRNFRTGRLLQVLRCPRSFRCIADFHLNCSTRFSRLRLLCCTCPKVPTNYVRLSLSVCECVFPALEVMCPA